MSKRRFSTEGSGIIVVRVGLESVGLFLEIIRVLNFNINLYYATVCDGFKMAVRITVANRDTTMQWEHRVYCQTFV